MRKSIGIGTNKDQHTPSSSTSILSIDSLSENERKNYEIKKELINIEGFIDMRILTKEDLLIQELTARGYAAKRIKDILETLACLTEDSNAKVNQLVMETMLLPKLEETYRDLETKGGTAETQEILDACHENGIQFITKHIEEKRYQGFNLRKCAKVARGEYLLFTTNENKGKYMILEIQQTMKEMDIDVLHNQKFYIRIHFDEDTDITKMSEIVMKGKKILDTYSADKNIRYAILSSRLFDDEFNDFWMTERAQEGKTEVPNRIKIREERLRHYGGKLLSLEPHPDDPIEDNFIAGEENSMMRAIRKYLSEGKNLKEGGGYIDLEVLERRKSGKKKIPDAIDLGFIPDEEKLRAINIPTEEIDIAEINYNMNIPYLEQEGTDDRNLTPRMLIENFDKEIFHAKKALEANLEHPIEIYLHKGKWIILDGVHRFTKAVYLGHKTIKIRRVSEEIAQQTKRSEERYRKRKGESK